MSISKIELQKFLEFAIDNNRRESYAEQEYPHSTQYWMGRAAAYQTLRRRIEAGDFDE